MTQLLVLLLVVIAVLLELDFLRHQLEMPLGMVHQGAFLKFQPVSASGLYKPAGLAAFVQQIAGVGHHAFRYGLEAKSAMHDQGEQCLNLPAVRCVHLLILANLQEVHLRPP